MVKRLELTRDPDPRPGMGNLFGTCNAGGVVGLVIEEEARSTPYELRMYS